MGNIFPPSFLRFQPSNKKAPVLMRFGLSINFNLQWELIQTPEMAKTLFIQLEKYAVETAQNPGAGISNIMIFVASIEEAEKLFQFLEANARTSAHLRNYVVCHLSSVVEKQSNGTAFANTSKQMLKQNTIVCCTQIAASGTDLPNVGLVFIFGFCFSIIDAVQSAGRTGRGDSIGRVVILADPPGPTGTFTDETVSLLCSAKQCFQITFRQYFDNTTNTSLEPCGICTFCVENHCHSLRSGTTPEVDTRVQKRPKQEEEEKEEKVGVIQQQHDSSLHSSSFCQSYFSSSSSPGTLSSSLKVTAEHLPSLSQSLSGTPSSYLNVPPSSHIRVHVFGVQKSGNIGGASLESFWHFLYNLSRSCLFDPCNDAIAHETNGTYGCCKEFSSLMQLCSGCGKNKSDCPRSRCEFPKKPNGTVYICFNCFTHCSETKNDCVSNTPPFFHGIFVKLVRHLCFLAETDFVSTFTDLLRQSCASRFESFRNLFNQANAKCMKLRTSLWNRTLDH